MKFIHTSDWHIGKIVNEFSMLEDQNYFFRQLIQCLKEEKPDALIIAGDLYDRSIPPTDAVERLDEVFTKIVVEMKIPVLAIAGNHDGAERLSFGSKLLSKHGLHIEGTFKKEVTRVTLQDKEGNVNFYLLPYGDPGVIREALQDEEIRSHNDGMKAIIGHLEKSIDKTERNILIAHGYMTYYMDEKEERGRLEISDSEKPLSIGGTDLIDARILDSFHYVALGHLHGAQKVGSDRIRYSGSPLKYSISECKQKKSITIVELNSTGEVQVTLKELPILRDIRVIKGPIDELLNRENQAGLNIEDYIFAELTDEGEIYDAMAKLRAIFPNVMGLRRTSQGQRMDEARTSASHNFRERTMEELFGEFYEQILGTKIQDDRVEVLNKVFSKVMGREL